MKNSRQDHSDIYSRLCDIVAQLSDTQIHHLMRYAEQVKAEANINPKYTDTNLPGR